MEPDTELEVWCLSLLALLTSCTSATAHLNVHEGPQGIGARGRYQDEVTSFLYPCLFSHLIRII
jgi:hypothetical protein